MARARSHFTTAQHAWPLYVQVSASGTGEGSPQTARTPPGCNNGHHNSAAF